MPEIGRPVSNMQNKLNQVGIRKTSAEESKSADEDKKRIIEMINGQKFNDVKVGDKKEQNIGKDEFLRMLTYQLQNQDPMNPMEENKFAAELAQFSQLEQLTSLNKKIDKLNSASQMEKKFIAASFVGKSVVTSGNSIVLNSDGQKKDLLFHLNEDSKEVLLRLIDEKGNIANDIKLKNVRAGDHQYPWDGNALDGFDSPKGQYKLIVKAWNEEFEPIPTTTKFEGIVEAVEFKDGETLLTVDGKKVNLRDVDRFHMVNNNTKKTSQMKKFETQQKSVQ